MTAVTNAHVCGTCLEMVGVTNIKIGCKILTFRAGYKILREKCDDLPFLQTLLPWADPTKEFAL